MKRWQIFTVLLLLSGRSLAALVDFGSYTLDSDTGLHWLDLSATAGASYESALTQQLEDAGWRYASDFEIEDIHSKLFENYVANHPSNDASVSDISEYPGQSADVDNMIALFGVAFSSTFSGEFGPVFYERSYGYYLDENSELKLMGAYRAENGLTTVIGLEPNFSVNFLAQSHSTFLVRTVPIPSAVWLFGSALVGVFGLKRRFN